MHKTWKIWIWPIIVVVIAAYIGIKAFLHKAISPNILLVVADDVGYSDLGAYGSEIATPNLDQLAQDGQLYTNFHVSPTSSPTRSMLLTGVDNHQAGLGNMGEVLASNQKGKPGYEGYLNHNVVTVATLLRDRGYNTFMVGKWHLGKSKDLLPSARGFDKTFILAGGGADHFQELPLGPHEPHVNYFADGKPVHLPKNFYSTNFYTQKMIDFIGQDRKDGKPFFAYVSYTAAHTPLQVPQKYIQQNINEYAGGWDKIRQQRFARLKQLGIIPETTILPPRPKNIPAWNTLTPQQQKYQAKKMAVYAGMMENLDENFGKLIQYLKKTGQYDNTIIIFISDNGAEATDYAHIPLFAKWYQKHKNNTYENIGNPGSSVDPGPGWAMLSNAPLKQFKGVVTEGGIRVPCIISWPGRIKPGIKKAFGTVTDITPTLLNVANVKQPNDQYKGHKIYPIIGLSMVPYMKGEVPYIYKSTQFIGFELFGNSALFHGDWKILKLRPPYGNNKWQLYNIMSDPSEQIDVARQHPELLQQMINEYQQYVKNVGLVPVPKDYEPLKAIAEHAKASGKK